MKNLTMLVLAITLSTGQTIAQTAADIFNSTDYEYTFFGIDFSHAVFIGDFTQFSDAGSQGMDELKNKYFAGWNGLMKNEKDKYNLEAALRKEKVDYNINFAAKVNSTTPLEKMEADYFEEMSASQIQEIVSNYDMGDKTGVGIVFITEYFNKGTELAGIHFVIFNIESKKVLIHERFEEGVGGFGLRNYWAKPFYLMISEVEKKKYKMWKKMYADQ